MAVRSGSFLALCAVWLVVAVAGQKIWTIGYGHNWAGYEYINDAGYVDGFSKDLIGEVCEAAGIQCRLTRLPYNWCWDSTSHTHSVGGKALMGGWVDACNGWTATADRIHVFDFSMPYLERQKAYFWTRMNQTFDQSNLNNKHIVFLDGWSADEKCVARQSGIEGNFLLQSQVNYTRNIDEFVRKIVSGEVDAGFAPMGAMSPYTNQVSATNARYFYCQISGNSMMTRKDNAFNDHWNRGFQKLRNSGEFLTLCEEAKDAHGHRGAIYCLN